MSYELRLSILRPLNVTRTAAPESTITASQSGNFPAVVTMSGPVDSE